MKTRLYIVSAVVGPRQGDVRRLTIRARDAAHARTAARRRLRLRGLDFRGMKVKRQGPP